MYSRNVESASFSQKDDESNKTAAAGENTERKKRERPVYKLDAVQLERKRESDRKAQRVKKQQTLDHIASLVKKIEELPDNSKICAQISEEEKRTAKLEEELRRLREEVAKKLGTSREVFDPVRGKYYCDYDESNSDPVDSASGDTSKYESRDHVVNSESSPTAWFVDDTKRIQVTTTTTTTTTTSTTTTISRRPRNPFSQSTNRVLTARVKSTPKRTVQAQFVKQPQIHLWELPLSVIETTSPLGTVLANILKRSNDNPRKPFREPKYPTFNLYGDREQFNALYPVAGVISDIFPRVSYKSLLEKVGALVYMYSIYRWQVARDYETYTDLPSHLQPILVQRTTPSPAWICGNGFPGLRKAVITEPEKYADEEFMAYMVRSLNVNWPYPVEAALVKTGYGFTITKAFWDHIMDFENWTLDEPFQRRYPELETSCNFTKRGNGERSSRVVGVVEEGRVLHKE